MNRLLLLSSLATACVVPPADLGKQCTLVRSDGDGGAEPIPKTDPSIAFAANQDILSFGATECQTHICARDSAFRDPPSDMTPGAKGYCSAGCGPCSGDFECRELLLDQQTLEAIKKADPTRYRDTFGDTNTPSFCARKLPGK